LMFFLRRIARGWTNCALAFALSCTLVAAPALKANSATNDERRTIFSTRDDGRFDCGYDPRGAEDETYNHRINTLRLSNYNSATQSQRIKPQAQDEGDIAVIEDDGTMIVSPSKFDLKKRSLVFTPGGEGYRITRTDIEFNDDLGSKLDSFLGIDNQVLDNADNGYRDIHLIGAQFTFYGISYDTIFIGTNGYITFNQGDTSPRVSAAALAAGLPRIAPLWADLNASKKGNIYYNRLNDRHVITWDSIAEVTSSGASTFQTVLYDDGRIVFVYKKIKAKASLVGVSPGNSELVAQAVDLSNPPAETVTGPLFETFSGKKRLDLPAITQAFYRTHADVVDTIYVWADFSYDNGAGVAHSFNVRNDIEGIGLPIFDRSAIYGSQSHLATIITMGNQNDWPPDPQQKAAGLYTAISIVCHELGHRWLSYIRFDAKSSSKDNLLGRDESHWSFLVDTRTNSEGSFSSLMEGNAWRDFGTGAFTTTESAANYFSALDEYLMGLRPADNVGSFFYLDTDDQFKSLLREKSPLTGFSMNATRRNVSIDQIIEREGPRVPDVADSPKEFRVAFILLTEQGTAASSSTIKKMDRYRDALVRYFSTATNRRGSLDSTLIRN
ncbi:MAG TPA: hypothetical protein VJX74_03685, partial [Blastocatellia bacterium]|nr:hypothetical protein [Blastocatellia bacterium]